MEADNYKRSKDNKPFLGNNKNNKVNQVNQKVVEQGLKNTADQKVRELKSCELALSQTTSLERTLTLNSRKQEGFKEDFQNTGLPY